MAIVVERLSLEALSEAQTIGWERLLQVGERQSLFVTPEWLATWIGELGADWTALSLRAVDGDDTLATIPFGLAPRRGPFATLSFLGSGISDYLAPLAEPRRAEQAIAACVDTLLASGGPPWDLMDLPELPADSPSVEWLVRAVQARGLVVDVLEGYRCPELSLNESWADYLQARGGHFRHWLRSKQKRLAKLGAVKYRHLEDESELAAALNTATALHAARWRGRGTSTVFSATEAGRRFYARVLAAYLRRDWADLALLELDGVPIASAVSLQRGDMYAYLVPAHDPAFDRHSPGGLLLAHLVERAHERGFKHFDFMLGDEGYKFQWANGEHRTVRLLAARPTPKGRAALAVARARVRLRAVLRKSRVARGLRDRVARVRGQ